jgi:hypothetical protein
VADFRAEIQSSSGRLPDRLKVLVADFRTETRSLSGRLPGRDSEFEWPTSGQTQSSSGRLPGRDSKFEWPTFGQRNKIEIFRTRIGVLTCQPRRLALDEFRVPKGYALRSMKFSLFLSRSANLQVHTPRYITLLVDYVGL